MKSQYIVPVIGRTYLNRNGGEYRCTSNMFYENEERMQRVLSPWGNTGPLWCVLRTAGV